MKAFKTGESIYPGMTYLKRLRCAGGIVGPLRWSPDGRFLAVPADSGSVFLWEMEADSWLELPFQNSGRLCSVAWSPDNRCLAAGFSSGLVVLWDVPANQWVDQEDAGSLPARVVWSTDLLNCAVIAEARMDQVVMLSGPERTVREQPPPPVQTLIEPSTGALSLSVSSDGALLVTSSADGRHFLWSLEEDRCITLLNPHPLRLYTASADFHPTLNQLATSGRTVKDIDLWEYEVDLLLRRAPLGKALASSLDMVRVYHGDNTIPRCYISRAPAQEKWAAKLARELRSAGVEVLKDSARLQADDWLLVAGAPEYLEAFPDESVLSARTDFDHLPPDHCIPLLVKGEWSLALPVGFGAPNPIPYDFTNRRMYRAVLYDLVLALYGIALDHQGFAIWRKELRRLSEVR